MDYLKELTAIVGASNYAATGDERWLKVASQAAADLPREQNLSAAEREPRFQKQRAIESAIMAFRPDFCEAAEILDAIRATLERRDMDETTREAIAVYGKAFRDCLDRADERVPQ